MRRAAAARFDAGLLAYAPQAWTSDDTDAVERLRDPVGHLAGLSRSRRWAPTSRRCRTTRSGRVTPLLTRAAVAMFGAFGYELDPTALADDEQAEVARQVAFYVERRELFQRGRFLRLRSPFEGDGNETAWMAVDDDGVARGRRASTACSRGRCPAATGSACAGSTRRRPTSVTTWMDSFAAPAGTADRGGRRADARRARARAARPADPAPTSRPTARGIVARRLPGPPVRPRQALTRPRPSSGPRRCSRMQAKPTSAATARQLDQSREDR